MSRFITLGLSTVDAEGMRRRRNFWSEAFAMMSSSTGGSLDAWADIGALFSAPASSNTNNASINFELTGANDPDMSTSGMSSESAAETLYRKMMCHVSSGSLPASNTSDLLYTRRLVIICVLTCSQDNTE